MQASIFGYVEIDYPLLPIGPTHKRIARPTPRSTRACNRSATRSLPSKHPIANDSGSR